MADALDPVEILARALCRQELIASGDEISEFAIDDQWPVFVQDAQAALAALEAAGLVLVPREPTDDMLDVADCAYSDWLIANEGFDDGVQTAAREMYKQMVAEYTGKPSGWTEPEHLGKAT